MSLITLTDAIYQLVLDIGYFDLIEFIDEIEFPPNDIAQISSASLFICTRQTFPLAHPHPHDPPLEKDPKIANWRRGDRAPPSNVCYQTVRSGIYQ